jgi:hypothetical protein
MPERVSDITEEGRLGQSDHSLIMLKVSSDSGPEVIKASKELAAGGLGRHEKGPEEGEVGKKPERENGG